MGQSNVDEGVFHDTKLTDGIYTRGLAGYNFVVTLAPRRYCGGVTLFYRYTPTFTVEVICQFSANLIACQMATGVEAVMAERPRGAELIVAGDFNVDL